MNLEKPSLFAEHVDDLGHDAFAREENRVIVVPRGFLIDELGDPAIPTMSVDQRGSSNQLEEKRLNRESHRNLEKPGAIGIPCRTRILNSPRGKGSIKTQRSPFACLIYHKQLE